MIKFGPDDIGWGFTGAGVKGAGEQRESHFFSRRCGRAMYFNTVPHGDALRWRYQLVTDQNLFIQTFGDVQFGSMYEQLGATHGKIGLSGGGSRVIRLASDSDVNAEEADVEGVYRDGPDELEISQSTVRESYFSGGKLRIEGSSVAGTLIDAHGDTRIEVNRCVILNSIIRLERQMESLDLSGLVLVDTVLRIENDNPREELTLPRISANSSFIRLPTNSSSHLDVRKCLASQSSKKSQIINGEEVIGFRQLCAKRRTKDVTKLTQQKRAPPKDAHEP